MFLAGTRPLFARLARASFPQTSAVASGWLGARPSGRAGLRLASSGTAAGSKANTLSWNEFFALRAKRRRIGLLSSIATSLVASGVAFAYFSNLVIDFNKTVMGIEMPWIYGGGIIVSGLLGWVVGPFLGNALFSTIIGARGPLFTKMDNQFLRHIARNRPDPSHHNVNHNPLPDFYGEKIDSVHGYRHWLRECRLFTKRAKKFV